MVGDWIKMRVWIARDPQVIAIADYLAVQRGFMDWLTDPVHRRCDESVYEHVTRDVTVSVTVASLLQVWGIACDRGKADGDDLVLSHTTLDRLDTIAGTPSFGVAMASVGWAVEEAQDGEPAQVRFPKALLYLVPTENRKQEAHAERQRRYRERQRAKRDAESGATSGATVAPQSDAREEERREENNTPYSPPGHNGGGADGRRPTRFKRPTLQEVEAYCAERNNGISAQEFIDHYETVGWRYGKGAGKPIRDWKAAVRTWEAARRRDDGPSQPGLHFDN